jgi:hypothetical protein
MSDLTNLLNDLFSFVAYEKKEIENNLFNFDQLRSDPISYYYFTGRYRRLNEFESIIRKLKHDFFESTEDLGDPSSVNFLDRLYQRCLEIKFGISNSYLNGQAQNEHQIFNLLGENESYNHLLSHILDLRGKA